MPVETPCDPPDVVMRRVKGAVANAVSRAMRSGVGSALGGGALAAAFIRLGADSALAARLAGKFLGEFVAGYAEAAPAEHEPAAAPQKRGARAFHADLKLRRRNGWVLPGHAQSSVQGAQLSTATRYAPTAVVAREPLPAAAQALVSKSVADFLANGGIWADYNASLGHARPRVQDTLRTAVQDSLVS